MDLLDSAFSVVRGKFAATMAMLCLALASCADPDIKSSLRGAGKIVSDPEAQEGKPGELDPANASKVIVESDPLSKSLGEGMPDDLRAAMDPPDLPSFSGCSALDAISLSIPELELASIDGKRAILPNQGTFCGLLTKPVGIFQIMKHDCEACRTEMESLAGKLAYSPFADHIQFLLVATQINDPSALEDLANLAKSVADGVGVHEDLDAWKEYAKNPNDSSTSTFVVMARSAQGKIFANVVDISREVINTAEQIARLYLMMQRKENAESLPEPKKLNRPWDGTSNLGLPAIGIIDVR